MDVTQLYVGMEGEYDSRPTKYTNEPSHSKHFFSQHIPIGNPNEHSIPSQGGHINERFSGIESNAVGFPEVMNLCEKEGDPVDIVTAVGPVEIP